MPTRDGWTMDREHEKVQLGRKSYRNMEEWSRQCVVCGTKFSIFTRQNAESINSSFGLKTCPEHRGQRPTGAGPLEHGDFNCVMMANANMTQELAELHAYAKTLFEENQQLKARLAPYELQGAMEAHADGLVSSVPQSTTNSVLSKMPWEA